MTDDNENRLENNDNIISYTILNLHLIKTIVNIPKVVK